MFFWVVAVLLINASLVCAQVGKIQKIMGSENAFVQRGVEKIILKSDTELEEGDEINSQDSVVILYLFPSTQMNIGKHSLIKLTKNAIEENQNVEKNTSVIDFIKGWIRIQVSKDEKQEIDQLIQANGVSFGVRGTEFEITQEGEDYNLDVVEGEVVVSSPYVQTFVPEIVKANEGFKFHRKDRKFSRRKFRSRLADGTGFMSRKELREAWRARKLQRKMKRLDHKEKVTSRNSRKSKRLR